MNPLLARIAALAPEKRALLVRQNPLSFAQRRLWFLDRLEPGSASYNLPTALRFSGALDVAALSESLAASVARHAILRTLYPAFDGEPMQLVLPPGKPPLPEIDLRALPPATARQEALVLAEDEAGRPFDLAAGPTWRAAVVRVAGDEALFLLNLHHILADGWSLDLLVSEMTAVYAGIQAGKPVSLPPPPIQFVDFARWQHNFLAGDKAAAQLAVWRRRLAGLPPVLELPADRPHRPSGPGGRHDAGVAGTVFPPGLTTALTDLGRESGASLFMVGLAGYAALLSRLTGRDDLGVGTPIVNRALVEAEQLVGIFLNMLALRVDLSGRPAFSQLLERVREVTLEAFDNQDLPFEMLVEELTPERLPGIHPIFQVVYTLVAREAPRATETSVGMAPVELGRRTAKYDLALSGRLLEGALAVSFQYDRDRIDDGTARRWLSAYGSLLAAAVDAPGTAVADLPLLSEPERWQVAGEWNDTAVTWPEELSIHQRIERQTDASPDAVALVYEGESVSYRELDRRANRLARHLAGLGVGIDDRVQICLPRSLDLVIAVLAVGKAGAAFVALDPEYPAERQAFLIADSAGKAVITLAGLAESFAGTGSARVLLDADAARVAAEPDARLGLPFHPEQLLFVLYTSGSTGRPKGTMNSHGGVLHRGLEKQRSFPAGPADVMVQKTPVTYDGSVWEYFWPLEVGARLVVARPDGHRDLPYLKDLLVREGVTVITFVPSVLRLFLEGDGLVRTESLRLVFVGGEAMTVDLEREFLRQVELGAPASSRQVEKEAGRMPALPATAVPLTNLYGPSETSIDVTTFRCAGGERSTVPIGRPIAGARLYVLDPELRPAPIGVPGEIAIGGRAVGRGYLGRPDATAERFVPDPHGAPGSRLYKTGDKGRFLPGGEVEFQGRLDFQVKIRGVRVELAEVEAEIAAHPGVAEAAVIARTGAAGLELAAFYVPFSPPGPTAADLRAFLRHRLPEAMVPSVYASLPALPLSPNAKVDRQALARLDAATLAPGRSEAAAGEGPQTPLEEVVAGIWMDLLKVPRVSRDDNFFDLGGHSLQGIRLTAHLRDALGVEIPVKTLFEAPTLAELAQRVSEALAAGAGSRRGEIERRQRRDLPFPASFAQERLWFLEQLEPGAAFYNIPSAMGLAGPVDPAALAASVAALVERHEGLRTTFSEVDGQPVQIVHPLLEVPLPVIDLSGLGGNHLGAELDRVAGEEARRPFDLERGPLLRIRLYRLAPEEWAVSYVLHHIVSDGWSSGVLMSEIADSYTAFASGRRPSLPPLPVQYPDFAVWQRGYLSGAVLEEQLAYWREKLGDLAPLELPTDRPRPAVETFRGAHHTEALSAETTAALTALARRHRGTLFMVLLSAWKALLARHSGQARIAVGSPIANRNRRELEGIIGFFANTLVLATDTGGRPAFPELFARVRETTLGAYAHEDLPFEKLVEELQPERDMSRNPLFQVMLVLQNQPREELPAGELSLRPMRLESRTAKFDFTIFWTEGGGRLFALVEHNTDLFDAPTAHRLFAQYERLLAGVLASPGVPLADLPLLAPEEIHQLVVEWNDTAAARPLVPVFRRVDEVAARHPEARAAADSAGRLSYRELVLAANRMAHGLRKMGVAPEARVGVCLERSLTMVVAALAVQKAGGALVALDPAYPDERLAAIVDDAGLTLLLTESALLSRFPRHGALAFCLEPGEDPFAGEPESDPAVEVDLDHPMYVIYTSGTTGQPKGIVVPHRAFANLLAWQMDSAPLAPRAAVAQISTFGFCVSFQEIFTTWATGGTLVVATEMDRRDFLRLPDFLSGWEIARLHLPFAALKQLAEVGEEGLPRRLSEVVTAGEQLRVTEPLRRLFGGQRATLANQYGASETHVVTSWTLTGAPEEWPAFPPIGRPVDNVRIHLLDERLAPVPVGVTGELYAGGACLPRGYWGDPVLTAQKLVPDPFAGVAEDGGEPGARLYRTGDAARHLAGGAIEHLGRLDLQVKVRGFRVEPGEVEAVLSRHPAVAAAAVVALPGADGARLAAYVVPAAGWSWAPDDLRQHLKGRLPDYMVPDAFVPLEALPLTANGKLDQAALPVPEERREEAAYAPPRNPLEEMLAEAWADVLGLPRVSIHGNFFELGGHSLLATRVISRLRATLDIELPLRALFEAPTVAGFAALVERERAGAARPVPPMVPAEGALRAAPAPLSFAQQRLWFIDRLMPGSPAYNLPFALRLSGALEVGAFRAAVAEITRRHETLRTTFQIPGEGGSSSFGSLQSLMSFEGTDPAKDLKDRKDPKDDSQEPLQVVSPVGPAVPLIDLSALGERTVAEAFRLVAADASAPFDLEHGPLFRPALLRLAADEHVALGTMHHIVSDGWSTGILARELTALYGAFVAGRPSPLPPLPVSYRDFSRWQRGYLSGEVLEAEIAHWRERLAGLPPLLSLPTDRLRPAVPSHRGSRIAVTFEPAFGEELRQLALGHGATMFMVLLSATAALLSRLSGQGQVALGSPIAGRNRAEIEGLIGFFVNTLVLPVSLAGDPSLASLLAEVRETTLDAFAHQDLPFEKLVEELEPARDLSHHPLFQVMFAVQNAPAGNLELPGLAASQVGSGEISVKFDLFFSFLPWPDGSVTASLDWSADLFEEATAKLFLAGLEALLRQAAADPEAPLSIFPLFPGNAGVPPAEPLEVNAGMPPALVERSLIDAFAGQVAVCGDAPAVEWGGRRLTYRELDAASDLLARRLLAAGLAPGEVAAIALPRSADLVVAAVAILKAGGIYLPLDLDAPAARSAAMLADARVRVVVASRGDARVPESTAPAVYLEEDQDPGDLPLPVRPPGAACLLFTSGSTGRPKGAAITESAILRLATSREAFTFGPGDRVGQVGSPAFDISILEIWGTLVNGACLVGLEREAFSRPGELAGLFERSGLTFLFLATSHLREIAREAAGAFAPLETLLFGGEMADSSWLSPIVAAGPPRRLASVYGPTETTVFVTWQAFDGSDGPLPLGRPLPWTRPGVADPHGHPLPAGLAGEITVGGGSLSWGYWNRPDLTAERFVPDPSSSEPGARLYRTGDLGRQRKGVFEFLGRLDNQVKIGGFRVEVGEIEAVLAGQPGIAAAVVLPVGEGAGRRLVAFYVAAPGAAAEEGELRRALGYALPPYMVPAHLFALETLPLNPNGKADRRALHARAETLLGAGAAPDADEGPRGPLEETLAAVFAYVLGVARVPLHASFFELGGHSLLATRAISRIREALSREVPLRTLFEAPSVAELAEAITAAEGEAMGLPLPPLLPAGPEERATPAPLSFAQQRLWFLDRLVPESPAYNLPFALHLAGPLDEPAFRAAVQEIVRRHEALRTTFLSDPARPEAEPFQVVSPEIPAVPLVDLGRLGESAGSEARRLARADAESPFDLARGPLFRPALLRLPGDEHVALGTMHHIVSDGWSMGVLVRELTALYGAFSAGRPSPLPELPLQYTDFARWQRRYLSGAVLDAETAHWRARLAGLPPLLTLPTDRPRPAVPTHRGGRSGMFFDAATGNAVDALAQAAEATPFMVLLAAFSAFLGRLAGQEEVAVGSPIAGRNRGEIEGLIGFFVNTLVLRTSLAGAPGLAGLLARVREGTLEAFAHQDLPFEKLVEELSPERALSHHPLFQVMMTLQNAPMGNLELPGLALAQLGSERTTAKFDLTLSFTSLPEGGLAAGLEWSADLFEEPTANHLLASFGHFLRRALAAPEEPLAEISLLSPEEAAELAARKGMPAMAERSIPEAFREQALTRPEEPAVIWGERRLSYADLDALSDRLALDLVARGLAAGGVAALALPRSPELIAAMLAVLKAGGAYLPLDLEAPEARQAALIEDSAACLVVRVGETSTPDPSPVLPPTRAERGAPPPLFELQITPVEGWGASPSPVSGEGDRGGEGLPYSCAQGAACVMYTSGSTGTPKGVVVPHRAILHLAASRDAYTLGPGDRVGQVGSPAFDASTWEIWSALLSGACLVGLEREELLHPRELAAALERERITHLLLTTAHLREVAREAPGAFAGLDTLLFGGEAAEASWLSAVVAAGPPRRLVNAYGPTETAVYVSYQPIGDLEPGAPVPIGRPLSHARLLGVDPLGLPLPAGFHGELWVGGESLALGYLGRPDQTAERFVPDPSSSAPGARAYRTGDLVRLSPVTGTFEFLGRADSQVKVRGFRIEVGEVEAALAGLAGVSAAAVVVLGDRPGEKQLAGFWVPAAEGGLLEGPEVRTALGRALPAYMVPARLLRLDALPLTPTGKVNRRALAARAAAEGTAAGAVVEARPDATPTEEILAGLWADLLRVERVHPEDDFFTLSGHSLLAVQAVTRLERAFGVEIPLRRLFEGATVAELAREIDAARSSSPLQTAAAGAIPRLPRTGLLPLTTYQQWGMALQKGTVSAFFNIPFGVLLSGPLSLPALFGALADLERRHEALRTRIVPADGENGGYAVTLDPPRGLRPLLADLSGLPSTARETELSRLAFEEATRPFDTAREPLFRALVVRLRESEHALLCDLHHLVGDGWSVGVLRAELQAVYAALSAGRPSPLSEPPLQPVDFAGWQREAVAAGLFSGQTAYWQERLAGAGEPLVLPGDRPFSPELANGLHGASLVFESDAVGRLRALARSHGATPALFLLTGIELLLHTYTGETDLLVNSTIAGRPRAELAGVVGFFMNTLVHRTDLRGEPGFAEALARTRDGVLEDYRRQDVPFPDLMAALFPERPISRLVASRVLFNMLTFPEAPEGGAGGALALTDFSIAEEHAKYDLQFTARDHGKLVTLTVHGAASRFTERTVQDIVADLETLLGAALDNPEATAAELLPRPRFLYAKSRAFELARYV